MTKFLILYILLYLAILLHEIGHTLFISLLPGKRNYKIRIGSGSKLFEFILRNYKFIFYKIPFATGLCTYSSAEDEPVKATSKQKVVFLLGGVFFNIIIAIGIYTYFYFRNIYVFEYGIVKSSYLEYLKDSFYAGTINVLLTSGHSLRGMTLRFMYDPQTFYIVHFAMINSFVALFNLIPIPLFTKWDGKMIYTDGAMVIKEVIHSVRSRFKKQKHQIGDENEFNNIV